MDRHDRPAGRRTRPSAMRRGAERPRLAPLPRRVRTDRFPGPIRDRRQGLPPNPVSSPVPSSGAGSRLDPASSNGRCEALRSPPGTMARRAIRSHRPSRSSWASTAYSLRLWARASWPTVRPARKPAASSSASPSYQRAPERAGKARSLRVRALRAPMSASSSPSQATMGKVSDVPYGELSLACSPPSSTSNT